MRKAVVTEISKFMKKDSDAYFLTGDLGYHVIEDIRKDFPDRFINVGIAEQNMVGIAAGLALSGNKVFVYSHINFLALRSLEQIRNDVCHHDLDVTFIGVGAGLAYGLLGETHYAIEDVGVMRSLPNLTIFSPCDEYEAVQGIKAISEYKHPVFFRLAGKIEEVINKKKYEFSLGKGVVLQDGKKITLMTSGPITTEVVKSSSMIEKKCGVKPSIVCLHTLRPVDEELIVKYGKESDLVVSVEEHRIPGGVGSIVLETLAKHGVGTKVVTLGIRDDVIEHVGSREFLRKEFGIDAGGIAKSVCVEFLSS